VRLALKAVMQNDRDFMDVTLPYNIEHKATPSFLLGSSEGKKKAQKI
jgi:hypothetical protein